LKIYDTLVGKKKEFAPRDTAKIFLCGPTVYDYSHVGHARMFLFYDMVARYLRFLGVRPKVIVNITDIDPKISSRATLEGKSPTEVSEFYTAELLDDIASLGISVFAFARVSDFVQLAMLLARRLLSEGSAYSASGNIYLDSSAAGFGRLSKMTEKELTDCRLEIAPGKKSPYDILLWNASESLGFTFSDNVLGNGMPWWHLQDTSVAIANFGGIYDIHGGANELIYPHHEAHLAQLTTLLSNSAPVSAWTHVGLVYIRGKKMSKSLGNTVSIRRLLQDHSTNTIRLYVYSTHYRNRLDFSIQKLEAFTEVDTVIANAIGEKSKSMYIKRFLKKLCNDFDTHGAIDVMIEAARAGSGTGTMAEILGLRY
jgi:cysteinyl-tRNA synthetase